MQVNLIPANKDPKVLIKEKNKYFWHVEQSRIDVNPKNSRDIRKTTWVKVYRKKDYFKIFEPAQGTRNFKPACLIAESRLVHDGGLQKIMDREAAAEKNVLSAEAQRAEYNRKEAEKVEALKAEIKAEILASMDDMGQGKAGRTDDDDSGTGKRPRRTKKEIENI